MRFEVLGPLRAWRGGDPLELGPVKRQAVLAALLLRRGAVVSHGRLLDSVWGEAPPAGGHKVLATHVNSLRRVVDSAQTPPAQSVIRSGKGWYRFVVDGVRLDTADLEERGEGALRAVGDGDLGAAVDQLSGVLALFRGEPLAGVPGPFAQEERERWEERRRTFRVEWLKCLVWSGRFGEALDDLSGLSASDTYDESLTALRMRALYGRGRPSEALRTYEELRLRLREELGTDPGEELRRVYEAVLNQDDFLLLRPPSAVASRARVPVVPAELPHDIPGFAGRADELAVLHVMVGSKSGNAVVVSAIGGAAGVGKTALAVHWAHQVRDRFPDGQLYVNLHGFDHDRRPLEPGEALELLLRSLGLAASEIPAHHEAQGRVFRTLLAGRRMLVLLDNAASAEQVRPLLPSSPSCCVVVTSRNRLGDLVARDGARVLALGLLQPDEARVLLRRILGAERIDRKGEAVGELIRLCGGLPLALRVAAARLAGDPALRTADLVAEMREGGKLEALELDADANSPLRTAFSVSYRVLAPGARRLFRLLGLFPGAEFTGEAAAALLDAPLPQARRLLGALVSAHLVEPVTVGRYRFHDLLREYARECALAEESAADRDAALERLLVWYLCAARAVAGPGLFPELPDGIRDTGAYPGVPSDRGPWLDAERGNLLAVIRHAAQHGPRPVAWYLTSTLFSHFWVHLPRKTWQTVARTALDAAVAEGDPRGRAATHSSLAAAEWDRGHVRQAMEHATQALDLSRENGWVMGEASALGLRGFARWSMAQLGGAHDDFSFGLGIFREVGHRYFEGFGLIGLGLACRDLGRLREAAECLEGAVRLEAEDYWWDAGSALQILGGVYWELGRLTDGLALLGAELDSGKRAGYRDGRAMMLDALARINVELGRHGEGLEQAERAFALVEDTKRYWVQSGILTTVAMARRRLGRPDGALAAGEQALALAREARFRRAEADSLLSLALTHKEAGRYDDARAHADQALNLARAHSFRVVEGQALTALCETAPTETAPAEAAHGSAVELGRDALAVHRETGHRLGEARTLLALARAHNESDKSNAQLLEQQARLIFSAIGVPETEYEGVGP
ncbi:BTAD domain-containing putative transcriptional regulator [Streptomyces sp. Amel2xC10]|uniref:AfsR/SARP family transcriptional regulator n=1 Tax=Streptomyces sp. Amel2xC10 TaxID=1305826 RepID=UPI00211A9F59|nr:BTAD domain-containing putative transcriptional regulator [Streptomyces sp. Amel2xC10]